ncbi:MAG: YidC/Oxa1 family membrane protein insertase [Candidatus Levybacteria bacterium]|nr:YidC/Oxa1 family membrane protein insertase [Candidatus Levybacteria bacterium]
MGNIFTILFIQPITNLLVGIYQLLIFLHIPYPLGFSVILLTIVIRFALFPLMGAQLRSAKKMQDMTPHLSAIKDKHKGDSQRIQAETMLLYKKHGINPAAGCLPVLVQLPVIWGLYSVLQHAVSQTSLHEINKLIYVDSLKLAKLWDTHFFGMPLGQNPSQLLATIGPGILLLPILTGASQFVQSKMMIPKKDPTQKSKPSGSDFASAFQTQSLYVFPLMIAFFSYQFPAGLSLYWITFTVFGIIQQYLMQKEQSSVSSPAIIDAKIVKTPKKKRQHYGKKSR